MRRAVLNALASHWLRHPGQLLALVLGLSVATALWSGVQAINAEARASYAAAANALGQGQLEVLQSLSGTLSQGQYIALRRAGWLVSPVLEGAFRVEDVRLRLRGIDPLTAPLAGQSVDLSAPDDLTAFVAGRLGFVHPETAQRLGLDALPFRLALDPQVPLGLLLVDIGTAQRLLNRGPILGELLLWPDQPAGLTPLATLAPDLVRRPAAEPSDTARLTDSFHLNLTAFGLLSFGVGLFIVHSAIGLSIEQRRTTLRTLRALGVPLRVLIQSLLLELAVLAALAAGLGLVLGYLIALALLPGVADTLRGLYEAEISARVALRPAWIAAGFAIAFLGAGLAAAQALWRVARMPIIAPAQPLAWRRASERALRQQFVAALALAAVAVVAMVGFSGLLAGFVTLAGFLLAAALALPLALTGVLWLGARLARGVLAEWFWADTRQQLPGLSLALMALMLALATNIGVGTMVSSFRLTFTGWLDQRLVAELYVTARDPAEALELRVYLETRADAVLPIWSVDGAVAGQPGDVFGVADDPTYRDHWPLLRAAPQVWDRVAAGEGVLVNEQVWRRAGLRLGDPISLPGGISLPLVGVYSDYGNPAAQAMMGLDLFDRSYPQARRLGYGLRLDPQDAPALRVDLMQRFGLPEALMIDQAAVKSFSLGVFERTFAVSAALNLLTLGVAGFAMLTSLLSLSQMRLPQLAPVWALGLTRARLARIELLRAALLAALTAVFALPVGLLLAWLLLAVVNVEAFGWRLPMHVFPAQWVLLGAMALLAALLAAAWPVYRLARIEPATLAKVFAHER